MRWGASLASWTEWKTRWNTISGGTINDKQFTKVACVAVYSYYSITAVFHILNQTKYEAEGGDIVMRCKWRKWVLFLGNSSPACVFVLVVWDDWCVWPWPLPQNAMDTCLPTRDPPGPSCSMQAWFIRPKGLPLSCVPCLFHTLFSFWHTHSHVQTHRQPSTWRAIERKGEKWLLSFFLF